MLCILNNGEEVDEKIIKFFLKQKFSPQKWIFRQAALIRQQ